MTFPNPCCVYPFELLNPGISHFLLTVKPVLYHHTAYHRAENECPKSREELAVEGTVMIHMYSSFTVKIKYLVML